MANVNSITNNTSSTASLYGSRNVLSGLASGMDTEAMIENSVSGYQTKIEDGKGGTIVSDSGEDVYSNFGGVGLYDDNANDPQLFWIGGTRYVAYVTVNMDSQNKACGYLRLLQIPGVVDGSGNYPIMIAMYQNKDNPAYFQRYALGDPDDFFAVGHESTNKTAFCDVLQTPEGETYILAGITSTGVSLFKVDY